MNRMTYATFPTAYADELRNKGQRQKARAFWEYYYDMERGEDNSVRFYSKSWGMSTGQTHKWVNDFNGKIDEYQKAWRDRNRSHYIYAKNQTEQTEHLEPNKPNTIKAQKTGVLETHTEQTEHKQPNKVLNINNNDDDAGAFMDHAFNDLWFTFSVNAKFKGKREDAYLAYRKAGVDVHLLKLASVQYLHDPETEGRRFNLANFIRNEVYLSYMPKLIRVQTDGKTIEGEYVEERSAVYSDGVLVATLAPERMVELYKRGALEFVNPTNQKRMGN